MPACFLSVLLKVGKLRMVHFLGNFESILNSKYISVRNCDNYGK